MFTKRRRPILDIAALKWVMRQKRSFEDGVARFPLSSHCSKKMVFLQQRNWWKQIKLCWCSNQTFCWCNLTLGCVRKVVPFFINVIWFCWYNQIFLFFFLLWWFNLDSTSRFACFWFIRSCLYILKPRRFYPGFILKEPIRIGSNLTTKCCICSMA